MTDKHVYTIVYGDSFRSMTLRAQQLEAERLLRAAGIPLRKPSLFRRVLAWLGISNKGI